MKIVSNSESNVKLVFHIDPSLSPNVESPFHNHAQKFIWRDFRKLKRESEKPLREWKQHAVKFPNTTRLREAWDSVIAVFLKTLFLKCEAASQGNPFFWKAYKLIHLCSRESI